MTDTNYQIVFRGDIAIGQAIEQVKARMGQLFKLSPPQVEKLFVGSAVVLKRGLSQDKAMQYKQAFAKTGAIVSVVAEAKSSQNKRPRESVMSLAPVGADLSPPADRRKQSQSPPHTDHLSVRANSGNLLDPEELTEVVCDPVVAGDWEVAELGAVIESLSEEALSLPILDADWDLADVGADLAPTKATPEPKVAAPALDIAPAGTDLVDIVEPIPLPEPDTSHIHLLPD